MIAKLLNSGSAAKRSDRTRAIGQESAQFGRKLKMFLLQIAGFSRTKTRVGTVWLNNLAK
jgi:hypothetical protein